jgi:VanZ family protein
VVSASPRSSALTLSLFFVALVLYASLFPFEGWRWPGVALTEFLRAPWPRYWTGFDVGANLVGYVPLGFLLALALLRSGWGRWAWPLAVLCSLVLSLAVETLQNFLPMRVPSNLDLVLNASGALLGATGAWTLERLGGLRRWSRFRSHWFEPQAHGSLVLLALWPFALLYPASVPFGLGQVWDRLELLLTELLLDTPFLQWLPQAGGPGVPLSPLTEALCVALGLLAPLLVGYGDVRTAMRRLVLLCSLLLVAVTAASLSSALTYGPVHAWAWINGPVRLGFAVGLLVALAALGLPQRLCHIGLLVVLAVSLSVLNRAPASAYFDQSLQVWEQGRFIRFHGLSQWLGWLWPYGALLFGLRAVVRQVRH